MHPFLIHGLLGVGLSADAPPVPASSSLAPPTANASSACVARATDLPGIDPAHARLASPHLIVVQKAARTVQLFSKGVAVPGRGTAGKACYRVGLGFAPVAHKEREGDGRTPEGWYTTSDKPWSTFYAAIAVHYPNTADAQAGAEAQRISERVRDAIITADRLSCEEKGAS